MRPEDSPKDKAHARAARIARQREAFRLSGEGLTYREIGAKLGVSIKQVCKYVKAESALPGPHTETTRLHEVNKLNKRERIAESFLQQHIVLASRPKLIAGRPVIDGAGDPVEEFVAVIEPKAFAAYANEMAKVAERRHKILGIEMPVEVKLTRELEEKLAGLGAILPEQYAEMVVAHFAGTGGPQAAAEDAARAGGQSTH